ncbi:hypothetical protein V8G54_032421 [Vigna mungo]|uniref:Uncharacterized protein n=1 Tax=Vigna mungo TaxID=3915 RepID=A0AAQ3RFA7_VIGMU
MNLRMSENELLIGWYEGRRKEVRKLTLMNLRMFGNGLLIRWYEGRKHEVSVLTSKNPGGKWLQKSPLNAGSSKKNYLNMFSFVRFQHLFIIKVINYVYFILYFLERKSLAEEKDPKRTPRVRCLV